MKVETNALVSMHYRLFDAEGELFESTAEDGPVRYRHGHDEILPRLEAAITGKEAGETLELTLAAEDAYGPYDPEGLMPIPRNELPPDHEYVAGEWISVSVEDDEADDDGDHVHDEDCEHSGEMEMRIVEVREDEIVLDANHPLAGQEVRFEVEVISVESSPDE